MNDLLKSVVVLVIVTFFSTSILVVAHKATAPLIENKKTAAYEEKLALLFPGFDSVVEKDSYVEVYRSGQILGYAVQSVAKGYAGDISFIVGLNPDKTIAGVQVVSQVETPGVGSRIASQEFLSQFVSKRYSDISLKKYGGSIDAITGATISSVALTESVRSVMNLT